MNRLLWHTMTLIMGVVVTTMLLDWNAPLSRGQDQSSGSINGLGGTYEATRRTMQRQAGRVGVSIHDDPYVLSTVDADVVYASVVGFEELTYPEDFLEGGDVGFLYLGGLRGVPDGFYLWKVFVDVDALEQGDRHIAIGVLTGPEELVIPIEVFEVPPSPLKRLTAFGDDVFAYGYANRVCMKAGFTASSSRD